MSNLILDGVIFSVLLILATNLESCPPSMTFSRSHPDYASIASRYIITALLAFPWITFARLRTAERAMQRVGTRLMLSTGMFSGKSYLSEILISVSISILILGFLAARRWMHWFVRRTVKLTVPDAGTESAT